MNKLELTTTSVAFQSPQAPSSDKWSVLPPELLLSIFKIAASQVRTAQEGADLWNTLRKVCRNWQIVANDPFLLPTFLINPLNHTPNLSTGDVLTTASLFSKHPFYFNLIEHCKTPAQKESIIFLWVVNKIDPNLKNPFMITLANQYAKSFQIIEEPTEAASMSSIEKSVEEESNPSIAEDKKDAKKQMTLSEKIRSFSFKYVTFFSA